jgi:hypothetical protein
VGAGEVEDYYRSVNSVHLDAKVVTTITAVAGIPPVTCTYRYWAFGEMWRLGQRCSGAPNALNGEYAYDGERTRLLDLSVEPGLTNGARKVALNSREGNVAKGPKTAWGVPNPFFAPLGLDPSENWQLADVKAALRFPAAPCETPLKATLSDHKDGFPRHIVLEGDGITYDYTITDLAINLVLPRELFVLSPSGVEETKTEEIEEELKTRSTTPQH